MKELLPGIIALLLAAGCTTVHRLDSTQHKVISVPQGLQDPATVREMTQRITNGAPVIFKVANGERMPLRLGIDLPMGTLEKTEYTFVFKHDTYMLLSQKGCELSPDGQRWASIMRPKALAKLFGSKHGEFHFGFNSVTNQKPFMKVDIAVK